MGHTTNPETIFALSSGLGRCGVAVLRVSGPGAGIALERIAGGCPPPRMAKLATLRAPQSGEPLDRALVLWFPAPDSFSGEDMAEFHVHGGRAVIGAVIEALAGLDGLKPAEPGAFTRRAFENGKLDLTEVEGLADLIDAETEAQRRQALSQSQGRFRSKAEVWREELVGAMALVESALDFSDEGDVGQEVVGEAETRVRGIVRTITAELADGRQGERLRDGFRVVLAGPPNAGKSSLLNAMARREAAIVSEEAGTTRDVIEVHLDLGGYPVQLLDTAGIRQAQGAVEEEGIRRTIASAADADLVIWLVDATDPALSVPDALSDLDADILRVLNKTDRVPASSVPGWDDVGPAISAKTENGLDLLIDDLLCRAESGLARREPALITRARHRAELEACRDALSGFLSGQPDDTELRAEDLRIAATALGRLTGRIDVEDILDRVFSDFCIGK